MESGTKAFGKLISRVWFIAVPLAGFGAGPGPEVQTLLNGRCVGCHGGAAPAAGLRLDRRPGSPVVIAGDSAASRLMRRVTAETNRMPPTGPPLNAADIERLRAWIDAGAPWPEIPPAAIASNDPADPTLLKALAETGEAALIARRRQRLARVPKPAGPGDIDGYILARSPQGRLAALCDDSTFIRRVYLDVIGVIPTSAEARQFASDTTSGKRERLIDRLLTRHEDYAANWRPFWEDALASVAYNSLGGIPTNGDFREWITRNFRDNRPYDLLVAELLDPAMPGHPASTVKFGDRTRVISFIRNDSQPAALMSAANVGQVFLGMRLKCASCHDHMEDAAWPQSRFLAFAGLFGGRDMEQIRCERSLQRTIPASFPFPLSGAPGTVPLDARERAHYAATLLTDPANPRFSQTIVNRLWKRYLGLGLYEPADDFREDRQAVHPELLEWLAYDLMEHGFDLKHTIRRILNSRTYQAAYDAKLAGSSFPSPQLRRLTAEQFLDSARVAVSQRFDPRLRLYQDESSSALSRSLGRPAMRNEVSTARPADVAVVQALELLNGGDLHHLIYSGDWIEQTARERDDGAKIEALYWAVLTRAPSADELALGVRSLGELAKAGATALQREIAWMDDAIPESARTVTKKEFRPWEWIEDPAAHGKAHRHAGDGEHGFELADPPLRIDPGDTLYSEVWLDPRKPPTEIGLTLTDGVRTYDVSWNGARLPSPGVWRRLEATAEQLGAAARAVNGARFRQTGGVAHWDRLGVRKKRLDPRAAPLGDMAWALMNSPEFHYVQ